MTESVAVPSKYEQRLTSLACAGTCRSPPGSHPAAPIMPIEPPAKITEEAMLPDTDTDTVLLALHHGGYRPEPLGDLAWVAYCPRDGALLVISDSESMSCSEGCSAAEVMRGLQPARGNHLAGSLTILAPASNHLKSTHQRTGRSDGTSPVGPRQRTSRSEQGYLDAHATPVGPRLLSRPNNAIPRVGALETAREPAIRLTSESPEVLLFWDTYPSSRLQLRRTVIGVRNIWSCHILTAGQA